MNQYAYSYVRTELATTLIQRGYSVISYHCLHQQLINDQAIIRYLNYPHTIGLVLLFRRVQAAQCEGNVYFVFFTNRFHNQSLMKHRPSMRRGYLEVRVRWKQTSVYILVALGLFVVGCGKRSAQVAGTVSYQGKSLPSGSVTFFNKDNQIVGSSTIANGKYKIPQTQPGSVKITVTTPPTVNSNAKTGPKPAEGMPVPVVSIAIPPKYGSPDQSGLSFEVKPGSQEYSIDLK
jgi:hypothetical protein